jgi:Double zinc ribbon
MYCRNCGNEINEKAVACIKCGYSPKKEKKFCFSCGVATDPNQVICTQCGVSLASQPFNFDTSAIPKFNIDASIIPNFDLNQFIKNKPALLAAVAFLASFLPWVKINAFAYSQNISFWGLSKVIDLVPNTILFSIILYVYPICLLGFIFSEYLPQLSQFKQKFSLGAAILIVYICLGLFLAKSQAAPSFSTGNSDVNNLFGGIIQSAQEKAKDMISIGFGFYVSMVAAVASFVIFRKDV